MTFTKHLTRFFLGGMAVCLLLSALAVSLVAFRPHQTLAAGNASPAIHKVVNITTNSQGTFVFKPKTLTIAVGTKVIWKNITQVTHTATSDDGTTFDSGFIAPGASFSFVFRKKGTFTYHCNIHPFMTGTIIVN